MKEYIVPDFNITEYEINDEIALKISGFDPNPGQDDWWGE